MAYYTRGQRRALTEAIAAAREVGLRVYGSDELENIHNCLHEMSERLIDVDLNLKELVRVDKSLCIWYRLAYAVLIVFVTACIVRQLDRV